MPILTPGSGGGGYKARGGTAPIYGYFVRPDSSTGGTPYGTYVFASASTASGFAEVVGAGGCPPGSLLIGIAMSWSGTANINPVIDIATGPAGAENIRVSMPYGQNSSSHSAGPDMLPFPLDFAGERLSVRARMTPQGSNGGYIKLFFVQFTPAYFAPLGGI